MIKWFLAWVVWSFAFWICANTFKNLNNKIKNKTITKLVKNLEQIDYLCVNTKIFNKMWQWGNVVKIPILLMIFWFYLFIFFNVVWAFLFYYTIYIINLKSWEECYALKFKNKEDHLTLSLLIVVPNAFAYQICIIIIDIFNGQQFFTLKQILFALCLRLLFGYPIIFVNVLEIAVGWQKSHGVGLLLENFFKLYMPTIKNSETLHIIKKNCGYKIYKHP